MPDLFAPGYVPHSQELAATSWDLRTREVRKARIAISGNFQYGLAPYVTRLAQFLGTSHFRKGQDSLDHNCYAAGINELCNLAQLSRIWLAPKY